MNSWIVFVLAFLCASFITNTLVYRMGRKRGVDSGFREGLRKGFDEGVKMGRKDADGWWIGVEAAIQQERQKLWGKERRKG